jgi:hypothetical protein
MKPVGGDSDGTGNRRRVLEPDRDPRPVLLDTFAAMAEMDGVRAKPVHDSGEQDAVKVPAVNRKMRIFVPSEPAAGLSEDVLAVAVEKGEFAGFDSEGLQGRLDPQFGQHANGVGHHVDADAQRFEVGDRFEEPAWQAAGMEHQRQCQPADPAADYNNFRIFVRHQLNSIYQVRSG